MTEHIRHCATCRHFESRSIYVPAGLPKIESLCSALAGQPDPVWGNPIDWIECQAMRLGATCGWEGRLWERKDE